MKPFESKHLIALLGVLALIVSGCASGGSKPQAQQTAQQFDAPEAVDAEPDKDLFSQALKAQNEGQFESAIKLWESFLSKHPESFEGHNNLGLVYYTQDMLSQSLREFETAYRLQRDDEIIRKNLARALRFKASMLHENREYFETLEILARLEMIVEPEEKQAILFKQEQVEDQIFLQVIKADNVAAYQDFINRFPDGLNTVRAREYLDKNPNKKVSKVTSNAKSWISSGKAGDASSWASAEQPPQYSSARPSAVYTPPAGGGGKKLGDFFGADPEGIKKAEEESANATPAVDPAAAIPFEDFEKPERASGDPAAAQESIDSKESRRIAGEFNPTGDAPATVTAGRDTLPDLTPAPVADLPVEMGTPKLDDIGAGEIEMQPVEQETERVDTASTEEAVEQSEKVETTSTEETAEPTGPEAVKQEEPEMAQAETAEPATAESESERIARIVQEEIANAESAPSEQVQPAPEQETDLESFQQETPPEVARIDPEDQAVKQETITAENAAVEEVSSSPAPEETGISQETVSETVAALVPSPPAPAENAQVEETPPSPAPEETSINQETVSETVAALMPSPLAPAEVMETSTDSSESSGSMVVIQMREGATLNVRAEPSTQGGIMGYLENGDMMPFMSESGDWYQIEVDEGLSGWISKKYSTLRDATEVASVPAPPSVPAPEEDLSSELTPLGTVPQQPADAMVIVTVSEDAILNVRSIPSASGAIVDMLFRGDKLPLVKEEGEWYQVQFEDETTGWISKKFSIIEGTTIKASLPVPQEKKKEPGAPRSNEMVTTVVVIKVPEGSSLNVRSAPSSKGQVMGSLKSGDMRPLLEEADEWYQVELQDGQSGWVSRKFSGKLDVDSSFLQSP